MQNSEGGGSLPIVVMCCLLCIMTPFIVCDFIFAAQDGCVQEPVPGISFPLSTWLRVDAYYRILVFSLAFICLIVMFFKK